MKLLVAFFLVALTAALRAETPAQTFAQQIAELVPLARTDFPGNRGRVAVDNENTKLFLAATPFAALHSSGQFITVSKSTGQAFFSAAYTDEAGIAFAEAAFAGLSSAFASLGNKAYEGYAANADMDKSANGDVSDTLFYHGIAVAYLKIPAGRQAASLYIGLIGSKHLVADKEKLPPLGAVPTTTLPAHP